MSASLWVLVADEGKARFLSGDAGRKSLTEIETLEDAAAHADGTELRRDAHGRRGGNDLRTGGSIMSSAGEDAEHLEAEDFATKVAARLAEGLQAGSFGSLRVYAAPRFLGLLRQAWSTQVAAVVESEHDLDLVNEPLEALKQRVYSDAA